MRSEENPYQPPTSAQSTKASHWTRLSSAVISALVGGSIGGSIIYLIYVDDSRTGTTAGPSLLVAVGGGMLCCSVGWAIAGAITCGDFKRILISHALAIVVVTVWISIGGTYSDVLGAATVVGWPIGGVLGAVLPGILTAAQRRRNA